MPDSNIETIKGLGQPGFTRLLQNIKANIPTKTSELQNDSGFLTSAPVTSVNGQTGAVTVQLVAPVTGVKGDAEVEYREGNVNLTPAHIGAAPSSHTHAASAVTSGIFDAARIPSLDASKITSGTLGTDRIPGLSTSKITSGTFDAARIPSLAASKMNSGTLSADRIPSLDASKIVSGSFSWDRVPKSYQHTPATVDLWSGDQNGAAISHGTTISNTISSQIGVHFQYILILYRTYAGSGDNYLQLVPFETLGNNGYERYGCGYGMGIHATSAGTHYSRGSIGYFYWNPGSGYFEWYVGTGYKGTTADTKAMVPLLIRGGIIY